MSEFSTNRFSVKVRQNDCSVASLSSIPDLCFDDGNIAILTGLRYFLVHEDLLRRHSSVLASLVDQLCEETSSEPLEGRPTLILQHQADEMAIFLHALYHGIASVTYDGDGFWALSSLLRLLTQYKVNHLRQDVLDKFSQSWPTTLSAWALREKRATDSSGAYAPRITLPHPILVINLAREIRAPELLPSAFYDLSRCQPSQAALGIRHSSEPDVLHRLSDTDLLDVLRGRETASRFLSTFIVDELEGREASEWCLHRNSASLARQRACGIAFEAITFELLRDVNGVVVNRNSDPLYTIADAELMQTRNESHALGNNKLLYLACEACLAEFSAVVEAARGEFWDKLPEMFGVKDLERWG